ncbi:gluconokinase [Frigoribacterium faeni]|uniref:Gluconokinase n=1 Tax=Frigoribacterium faeni TaxID=145483 RepID=A0A7W3JI78_9MICO|nr:gluconokinase [Frigoribacterium faeni]MBA8813293.1 carbohydrate kinase (thermoresistant glucokinase family) [Frigoribacterium faeni]GEK84608.1 gluconokinase [Frigoribacterium faeni]
MAVIENVTGASSAPGPYAADPVLVVMGVSGSGKSTLAALLAEQLGWDFYEGDDLHPDENVAKMAAGTPLDDDDRAPWLDTVSSWIIEHAMAGVPGVITCSALKRKYRDVLREHNVVFVYLRGTREMLGDRMAAREGHFMPTTLLDSQVATLEPPEADERHVVVDAGRAPEDEVDDVIRLLGLTRA